jgi:predicted transcriptional regulator
MKKKVTVTLSEELVETLSYLSAVLKKNQNEIIETAFWEWWDNQNDDLKTSINQMINIASKVRKNS